MLSYCQLVPRSAFAMAVHNAASAGEFERLTATQASARQRAARQLARCPDASLSARAQAVAHFWAPWCEPCTQMDVVFTHLAASHPGVTFVRVCACLCSRSCHAHVHSSYVLRPLRAQLEAEEVDEVSMKHNVPSVPYFLLFKARAGAPSRVRVVSASVSDAHAPCRRARWLTDWRARTRRR